MDRKFLGLFKAFQSQGLQGSEEAGSRPSARLRAAECYLALVGRSPLRMEEILPFDSGLSAHFRNYPQLKEFLVLNPYLSICPNSSLNTSTLSGSRSDSAYL